MYNVKKFFKEHDIIHRYGAYVNKILVDHAFEDVKDPLIRQRYLLFLKKAHS